MNFFNKTIYVLILAVFFISCSNSNQPENITYPDELVQAQEVIVDEIELITKQMDLCNDTLKTLDINANESRVRAMLNRLADDFDYVEEALIMSNKGVLDIIEPAKYQESEGADVSDQEQIIRLLRDKKPVTSKIFKVVEGYNAIVYIRPVIVDGNIKVSLAVLIDPAKLFKSRLEPIAAGKHFTFFVLENTGLVLYDPDPSEIGLNTITDPLYQAYPEVIKACKIISQGEQGKTYYTFFNTGMNKVDKFDVWWKTVRIIDSDWKIVYKKETIIQ